MPAALTVSADGCDDDGLFKMHDPSDHWWLGVINNAGANVARCAKMWMRSATQGGR